MKPPSSMHTIQVEITGACDIGTCSNCTRLLQWRTPHNRVDMPLGIVERAINSLCGYRGILGIFGGNPCYHEHFVEVCKFLQKNRKQHLCGLWSNNINGHGDVIGETFGYYNLNVHQRKWNAELMRLEIDIGRAGTFRIFGEDSPSYHHPPLLAIRDFIPDNELMWRLIDKCPVNNRWSACIAMVNGEPLVYFCEIAASFEQVYGRQAGLPLQPDWWRWPYTYWEAQRRYWCPRCGMALPYKARADSDCKDDVSVTHVDMAKHKGYRMNFCPSIDYNLNKELAHWDETLDYQLLRTTKEERDLL